MCPLKRMKIKDKGDPWVTREIIELIQDKDRLRIRAKRSESQADWNEAKAARNFTKQVIRGAKAKFISDSLDTHDKNPKKFWETMNKLVPKNNSSKKINLINQDTKELIDDEDTPIFFYNDYFANIGPKLAEEFH